MGEPTQPSDQPLRPAGVRASERDRMCSPDRLEERVPAGQLLHKLTARVATLQMMCEAFHVGRTELPLHEAVILLPIWTGGGKCHDRIRRLPAEGALAPPPSPAGSLKSTNEWGNPYAGDSFFLETARGTDGSVE